MTQGPAQLALLFVVGAVASGINTVAGGGSLISFPMLTWLGMPSLIANTTNSVGLWPGSLSGAVGYWNHLPKTARYLKLLTIPTIVGSLAGTLLLLQTGNKVFTALVPFLLLSAALLLWFQPQVKAFVAKRKSTVSPAFAAILQFLVAIYGGYFGAGMGIMMLAVFVLFMNENIHEINAVKNWLGVIINVVASIMFFSKGIVVVDAAIALALGSLVGGFASAKLSQKVDSERLRTWIATYGVVMALVFAARTWFGAG